MFCNALDQGHLAGNPVDRVQWTTPAGGSATGAAVYGLTFTAERSVHTDQTVIPRRARGYEIAGGAVAAGRPPGR